MKTKFYKRLVPLALIASMAVTNVGITSASAQEVTASYGQTVETGNVDAQSVNTPAFTFNGTVDAPVVSATAETFAAETAKDDPIFQIPGGLTSKEGKVNGYTVGIAKIVDSGNNIKENTVTLAEVKAHSAKTGKFDTGVATGDYVLYYATGKEPKIANDTTNNVTFFRKLSTNEVKRLPKTYKTEATLTTDSGTPLNGEKGVMDAFVKAYIKKYFFNETVTASDFGNAVPAASKSSDIKNLIDDASKGDLKSISTTIFLWKSAPDALTKTEIKEVATVVIDEEGKEETNIPQEGQIEVPAVDKAEKAIMELGADDAIVKALIKDTDGTNGKDSWVAADDISDGKISTDSGKGWDKLLKTAKTDPKKYFGKMEIYTQLEARAKALFLNYLNDETYKGTNYDLSKIVWVMETTDSSNKTNVNENDVYPKTSGNAKFWGKSYAQKTVKGVATDVIGTKDSSEAKTRGASALVTATKPAGKFNSAVYIKGVTSDYTPAKKGQDDHTGRVCFTQGFYIPPAVPTAFTSKSLTPPASKAGIKFEKATVAAANAAINVKNGAWKDEDELRNYKLTIEVGKSFKLPFALADGQEKDLVYEVADGSSGFTVINGKVTGTDVNTNDLSFATAQHNTIRVYSRSAGRDKLFATVSVKVDPAVKSVRSNVSSIAVWPGSDQTISLGTVPASSPAAFKYKVSCSDSNVELCDNGGTALGSNLITNGKLRIKVANTVDTTKIAKGATIKVELCNTSGTKISLKKDYEIKVAGVAAPQDIKSIKTSVKSKETTTFTVGNDEHVAKVINVPVGGSVNLGYTPSAGANASIKGEFIEGTISGAAAATDANADKAIIAGDVITGNAVGTEIAKLTPHNGTDSSNLSDSFKVKDTEKDGTAYYVINVYEPGATITLPDTDYAIKGGFLMTKTEADTTCDYNFQAGKKIVMTPPKASTSEPIIWKANDPSAVKFVEKKLVDGDISNNKYEGKTASAGDVFFEITPAKPGIFTITGITKYTKQKLSFKIAAKAANASGTTTGVLSFTKDDGTAITLASGTGQTAVAQTPVYVGDKINACLVSGADNVGGPVEFSLTEGDDIAKISKTGVITVKGAGTIKVHAAMTAGSATVNSPADATITVSPAAITLKSAKVASGAIVDTDFAVSAALNNYNKKNVDLEWYAVTRTNMAADTGLTKANIFTDGAQKTLYDGRVELGIDKEKLNGKVQIDAAGLYDVYVNVLKKGADGIGANAANVLSVIKVGTVRVYDEAIKKADLNMGDADTKKAIANLGAKPKDATNSTNAGTGNGRTYYIPIFVTDAEGNDVAATNTDDVEFDVSNKSLLANPTTGISFIPRATIISTKHLLEGKLTSSATSVDTFTQENDIVKNYAKAYGVIKVETATVASGLKGVLTVKAKVKNTNKTLSFTMNLLGADLAPALAYAPQTITAAADQNISLSAIVKADKADDKTAPLINKDKDDETDKKKLEDIAKAKKLAEGKKITAWQYVLVNDSKIADVNKALDEKAFICKNATVNQTNLNSVTLTPPSDLGAGTYYLALAQVDYEVATAYVAADSKAEPAVNEASATFNDGVIKKVISIACKTPLVKASS